MSKSSSSKRARMPLDGESVGPYVIREEIGKGSFATVFRAEQSVGPPQVVAIKIIEIHRLSAKLLENVDAEIRLMKSIRHQNIVQLIDSFKTSAHFQLIMDYCPADLSYYIKKKGRISALSFPGSDQYPHHRKCLHEAVVRCFTGQLAEAIKVLRSADIVHRDIKPQNLLLRAPEDAALAAGHPPGIPVLKVADFGFARLLPQATLADTLCGSPLYMAPEILGWQKYDARADLWSFGAVLFEMTHGTTPFKAANHVELEKVIIAANDNVPVRTEVDSTEFDAKDQRPPPPVPKDIADLIRGLLKRKPADRMPYEDFYVAAEVVKQYPNPNASAGLVLPKDRSASQSLSLSQPPLKPIELTGAKPQPPVPAIVSDPQSELERALSDQPPAFARTSATRRPSDNQKPLQVNTQQIQPPPTYRSASTRSSVPPSASSPREYQSARNRRPDTRDLFAQPQQPELSSTPPKSNLSRTSAVRNNQPGTDSIHSDDDSFVGREYVVVEKRAVEVNALADDLANMQTKNDTLNRRNSRGFLTRQLSALNSHAVGSPPKSPILAGQPYPPSSQPIPVRTPSGNMPPSPTTVPMTYGSSPRSRPPASSSPRSYSAGLTGILANAANAALSLGSPGTTLVKTLNLATLKVFGSPSSGQTQIMHRERAQLGRHLRTQTGNIDPEEEVLLAKLEDYAQKASVIIDYADEKMLFVLTAQNPAAPPMHPRSASSGSPASLQTRAESPLSGNVRRSSNASQSSPVDLAQIKITAAESFQLYLKALAFITKAVDLTSEYWLGRHPAPANPGLNEAVQWFRARFNECMEKVNHLKGICWKPVGGSTEAPPVKPAEALLYDRALDLSRAAAMRELHNEKPKECESVYESALWLLQAMLDDVMREDADRNSTPEMEEALRKDREDILRFIKSIRVRLEALRKKSRESGS